MNKSGNLIIQFKIAKISILENHIFFLTSSLIIIFFNTVFQVYKSVYSEVNLKSFLYFLVLKEEPKHFMNLKVLF